jgi:hypothetical protein
VLQLLRQRCLCGDDPVQRDMPHNLDFEDVVLDLFMAVRYLYGGKLGGRGGGDDVCR